MAKPHLLKTMGQPALRRHLRGRNKGHRGGAILPHRSIWSLQLPWQRLAVGVLIASGFTGLLALLQPLLAQFWGGQLVWWMQQLGVAGQFAPPDMSGLGLFAMPVPLIDILLPDPGGVALAAHALACAALWMLAGWLPDSGKPGAYLLRFAVLIHAASVLYFALWPGSFPHSAISHLGGGLRQSWALLLLSPWLHLCTYYLFPFATWQRLALTGLTLLYLAVLAPLQYATHGAMLVLSGAVAMPLLHLLFGVMVPILGLVALYGWAMSWHDPADGGDRSDNVVGGLA